MAIQQLDLWGNPVAIPEKEDTAKGSNASFKQESIVVSTTPPSLPLFNEDNINGELRFNKNRERRTDVLPIEVSNEIIETTLTNENENNQPKNIAEQIEDEQTIENENPIEIATEESKENTTIPNQVQEENRVVYSDKQILVKLKERSKGSTKQELVKKEVPTPYSTVNTSSKKGRKSFKEIDGSIDLVKVPDDETLKKKLYHGITEVAEWFGVNNSQIRYWENEFDVLKPRKTRKGDRLFRYEDIKTLQLIHHLLRNRKFSIEGAKDYLKANKQQADIHFELTQTLSKFRSFLIELRSNLDQ